MATNPKATISKLEELALEVTREGQKRLAELSVEERARRHDQIMELAAKVRRERRGKP